MFRGPAKERKRRKLTLNALNGGLDVPQLCELIQIPIISEQPSAAISLDQRMTACRSYFIQFYILRWFRVPSRPWIVAGGGTTAHFFVNNSGLCSGNWACVYAVSINSHKIGGEVWQQIISFTLAMIWTKFNFMRSRYSLRNKWG